MNSKMLTIVSIFFFIGCSLAAPAPKPDVLVAPVAAPYVATAPAVVGTAAQVVSRTYHGVSAPYVAAPVAAAAPYVASPYAAAPYVASPYAAYSYASPYYTYY